MMSLGLMLKKGEAVLWRDPILMGALQQLPTQATWGPRDEPLIDLPPGTGDIPLTLCQRTHPTGAIVVSTPQDVALPDARKALDLSAKPNIPMIGLIENMSTFCCLHCGHETQIFGRGGVRADVALLGLPFHGDLPLTLCVRLAQLAQRLIAAGIV